MHLLFCSSSLSATCSTCNEILFNKNGKLMQHFLSSVRCADVGQQITDIKVFFAVWNFSCFRILQLYP